jgi:hypothetical protein
MKDLFIRGAFRPKPPISLKRAVGEGFIVRKPVTLRLHVSD